MKGTRFIHTDATNIYLPTGLRVKRNDMPSQNALRIFVDHVLTSLLADRNPVSGHRCTSFCGKPAHFIMGFPNAEDLKSAVTEELQELIRDFEILLTDFYNFAGDEDIQIQTLAIKCLPCVKVVEVLEVSIYC